MISAENSERAQGERRGSQAIAGRARWHSPAAGNSPNQWSAGGHRGPSAPRRGGRVSGGWIGTGPRLRCRAAGAAGRAPAPSPFGGAG